MALGGRLLRVELPQVGDVVVVSWARRQRPLGSRPRATVSSTGSGARAALSESTGENLE